MSTLFCYSIAMGIFLLAGYGAYRMFLSGEKQPGLNRVMLLSLYLVGIVAWPLMGLFASMPAPADGGAVAVADVQLELLAAPAAPASRSLLPRVALWCYAAGFLAVALWTVCGMVRLACLINGGRRERRSGYTLVLLKQCDVPFSFMHYVVMSESDAASRGDVICAHELGHLRHGHWLDLLLAQAVCAVAWYNPAAWLMRAELRRVHEYQADEAVLSRGFDVRSYQMLLIEKAAGVRLQSLANSLNHSNLSKRITMMYKQNNRAVRRMRVLALVPALVAAVLAVDMPAVASTLSMARSATFAPESAAAQAADAVSVPATAGRVASVDKVTEKNTTGQAPAKLPQYPGGDAEMFKFLAMNVRYPAEAMKANEQGRVTVSFVVGADGSINDVKVMKGVSSALDAEAVRVVASMPRWTPARNEAGEPVACSFALPVTFKLTGNEKKESGDKAVTKTFDDVVVVGYGTQKKSEAASTSGMSVVMTGASAEAHQDEATGMRVIAVSSTPVSTFPGSADGGPKPDYFVNGKPYEGDINSINPSDIESVSVYKDRADHPNGLVDIKLK